MIKNKFIIINQSYTFILTTIVFKYLFYSFNYISVP